MLALAVEPAEPTVGEEQRDADAEARERPAEVREGAAAHPAAEMPLEREERRDDDRRGDRAPPGPRVPHRQRYEAARRPGRRVTYVDEAGVGAHEQPDPAGRVRILQRRRE